MISLITPNYNGEKWLPSCIDSVACQTAPAGDYEMIVSDDDSTDGSVDIINKSCIENITLIENEHTGLPGAMRNRAIQRAIGNYVLFLDSDDLLGRQAIERLDKFANETDSDIIAFQLKGLNRRVPTSMFTKTTVHADIVSSGLYKTLGTWKMCKKDFIKKNHLAFSESEGRGEDILYFTEAMLKAEDISILSGYPFYTVRGREDGSSITQSEWDHQDRLKVSKRMGEIIVACAQSDDIANHFLIRLFNTDAFSLITSRSVEQSVLDDMRDNLSKYWTKDVSDLIYTDEVRKVLINFFGDARS